MHSQKCAQVGRFQRSPVVEYSRVVPARFVAVAILWQSVVIRIAVTKVPLRPAFERPIDLRQMLLIWKLAISKHPGESPSLDGRFRELPRYGICVPFVWQGSFHILHIEWKKKLIPRKISVTQ